MPWLIAVRVVSLPATASRMKNGAISLGRQHVLAEVVVHQRRREVVGRVRAALLGQLVHERRSAACPASNSAVERVLARRASRGRRRRG